MYPPALATAPISSASVRLTTTLTPGYRSRLVVIGLVTDDLLGATVAALWSGRHRQWHLFCGDAVRRTVIRALPIIRRSSGDNTNKTANTYRLVGPLCFGGFRRVCASIAAHRPGNHEVRSRSSIGFIPGAALEPTAILEPLRGGLQPLSIPQPVQNGVRRLSTRQFAERSPSGAFGSDPFRQVRASRSCCVMAASPRTREAIGRKYSPHQFDCPAHGVAGYQSRVPGRPPARPTARNSSTTASRNAYPRALPSTPIIRPPPAVPVTAFPREVGKRFGGLVRGGDEDRNRPAILRHAHFKPRQFAKRFRGTGNVDGAARSGKRSGFRPAEQEPRG